VAPPVLPAAHPAGDKIAGATGFPCS
jgi:hypothetical protein